MSISLLFRKVDLSGLVPSSLPEGVIMSVQLSSPVKDEELIQVPCILVFSSSIPISITDSVTFLEKNTNIK